MTDVSSFDSDSSDIPSGRLTDNATTTSSSRDYLYDEDKAKLPFRTVPQQDLGTFGEGGASTPTLFKGRIPKKIGHIKRGRFASFDYDVSNGEFKPYLLDLKSLYLTELAPIDQYLHVTYIDLKYNKLTNNGVTNLAYLHNLTTLILDHNKIRSTTLPRMPNLIYLSLNKNLITAISKLKQPNVEFLYLNENKIRTINNVDSKTIPKLNTLSICHCQLVTMSTNYSHTLQNLYLSYNNIRRVEGLDALVNLKILHLRGNQITKLTGFSNELSKLYYLNLRENNISEGQQLALLKVLPMLRILILSDNPLNDSLGKDIRQMVLMNMPDMRRINKYLVDDDEEMNARRLIEEAVLKDEKERQENRKQAFEGEGGEAGKYSDAEGEDDDDD